MKGKLLIGLAVIAALLLLANASLESGEKKKAEQEPPKGAPPDIKIGSEVQFVAPAINSYIYDDARAPKATKISGAWIYFEGISMTPSQTRKVISAGA